MMKVTLVYPYFHPANDSSIFRHPPLGLGYIAASLRRHRVAVELVDCTFLDKEEAIERITHSNSRIIGIYAMYSIKRSCLELARRLRAHCELLVVGGPLPSLNAADFLQDFDVAAIGEGEETMVEIADCIEQDSDLSSVKGIAYKKNGHVFFTPPRNFISNLDESPFPSRDLFDNESYKRYYSKKFGYTTTSMITSRGCPFSCDFCSRPIFGNDFRTRSPNNIVDEVESIASMGYDRVWFSDDCFTLNRSHIINVCNTMIQRGLTIGWECLSRVDTMDQEVARKMKQAGCIRVFFGIESGNNKVLALMNKRITIQQAHQAVHNAKKAGLQVGAFFIVGYPGETNNTLLDTVNFASSLPLDYLSFTLPYPIPGTSLYERVKNNGGVAVDDWEEPKNYSLIRHKLLYGSKFSEAKLRIRHRQRTTSTLWQKIPRTTRIQPNGLAPRTTI